MLASVQKRFNTHCELIAYMRVHTHRHQLDLISCCGVCNRSADERQEAGSVTAAQALQPQQFTQQWSTKVGLH